MAGLGLPREPSPASRMDGGACWVSRLWPGDAASGSARERYQQGGGNRHAGPRTRALGKLEVLTSRRCLCPWTSRNDTLRQMAVTLLGLSDEGLNAVLNLACCLRQLEGLPSPQ